MGETGNRGLDDDGRDRQRAAVAIGVEVRQSKQGQPERLGRLVCS